MTQGRQPIHERADCVRALGGNHIEGWDASQQEILEELGLRPSHLPDESESASAIWNLELRPKSNPRVRVRSYRWRS